MCIFCQIVSGEIPAKKVYENERVLAFLDVRPVNPGHTLVILKQHYRNLEEIPVLELQDLIVVVKKIGERLKARLNLEGYNVILNNGATAGQTVPHLHFHLIPRHRDDGYPAWSHVDYESGEAEKMLEILKN